MSEIFVNLCTSLADLEKRFKNVFKIVLQLSADLELFSIACLGLHLPEINIDLYQNCSRKGFCFYWSNSFQARLALRG